VGRSFELIETNLAGPELLRIFIQEIDPHRFTRPTITYEIPSMTILDKNIGFVALWLIKSVC